eukprot:Blabericola_migrator_1__30@NODE_1008_length_5718_cov_50_473191_g567_i2_p3_GENE_NODE_1008_length_5718_cov_50_473191_g567_i2NODE_1008_length_5718_cov_50_473191_g567_i2_p3_ORF_typecomplete_len217_score29_46SP_CPropep/PF08999_10/0_1SP_CPropep/PF08999_10/5_2e03DUF2448/PF10476_9/0_17_NODE_1008_length_5718_cov_50_473191_g567_i216742324
MMTWSPPQGLEARRLCDACVTHTMAPSGAISIDACLDNELYQCSQRPSLKTPKRVIVIRVIMFLVLYVVVGASFLIYWHYVAPNLLTTSSVARRLSLSNIWNSITGSNSGSAGSGGDGVKPDIAYAKGLGSAFWLYGNVLDEYPFMCKCDTTKLDSWYKGELANQASEFSPVPCLGQPSTALISSDTYCDPVIQPPSWYTGDTSTTTATTSSSASS